MAKILAPNTEFNGMRLGVVFTDGVGHTDDDGELVYFRRHGFTIEASDEKPTKAPEASPLDGLKVDELKAYATEHGIDVAGATKKPDLLEAITNAEDAQKGDPSVDA